MSADSNGSMSDTGVPMRQAAVPAVNLLWTGGWDSSFQLLQLLLLHGREVVPHYLLDPTRSSTRAELAAMERIRHRLFEQYPQTRTSLKPLQCFDMADLAPDARIADAYDRIRAQTFLGNQYEWLARFRDQRGIAQLELAAGYRDGRIHHIIEPFVLRSDAGGYGTWRLGEEHRNTNEFTVFGGFSFPLFELKKAETAEIAGAQGWLEILKLTCFCHRSPDGKAPCGYCNPCLYAVDEGFGWRIPRRNRVKGTFYRALVRPMKAPVKAALRHLGMRAR
ncbi:hypothetical protein IP90_02327 [Luteimonas cucumeris]|uniref:7-cyano-7-deazaguanine synthase n=1 Tax=Luteimonas cucumeris TaxID=985012 RepID=A0A562L297_9GAMM|nr:hypothetical protein [Luteimonas cucumeris]TWI01767.1 hypothetical protein IP90_02327 [Luteimonas cucumeris]